MAVLDEYVNASLISTASRRRADAKNVNGQQLLHLVQTFEVAAADDDGSVYRIFPNIPCTAVIRSLRVACDALTGSTDWDVGLYLPNYGAVVDKDILADGINLSAGYSRILALDGLVTVDLANANKMLYELPINGAALTLKTRSQFYDICMTANTVGSGAGTVTVEMSYFLP